MYSAGIIIILLNNYLFSVLSWQFHECGARERNLYKKGSPVRFSAEFRVHEFLNSTPKFPGWKTCGKSGKFPELGNRQFFRVLTLNLNLFLGSNSEPGNNDFHFVTQKFRVAFRNPENMSYVLEHRNFPSCESDLGIPGSEIFFWGVAYSFRWNFFRINKNSKHRTTELETFCNQKPEYLIRNQFCHVKFKDLAMLSNPRTNLESQI